MKKNCYNTNDEKNIFITFEKINNKGHMYNQEEKQELYPTDFFQLTKSYDEILADHDLIKKMKLTLQQAGMRQYAENCSFEELIKEAYFQCGIILRRSICPYYGDYIDLFIDRKEDALKNMIQ